MLVFGLNLNIKWHLFTRGKTTYQWPVSDSKRAINKKNILTFMVSGDSMHLLFCVLSIEIG